MTTVKRNQCDGCGVIINEDEGIKIQGNIYNINYKNGDGGLVGNSFVIDEQEQITEVKSIDFCAECFMKAMTEKFRNRCREFLEINTKQSSIDNVAFFESMRNR